MIIGSGLLAKAFVREFGASASIWIYAAGVSNSGCSMQQEFERERQRLLDALQAGAAAGAFVYFSTCSITDPKARNSAYVRHKMEMEKLVSRHPNFIVARLSNVAGTSSNPHTLLNYLYGKVSKKEKLVVWKNATRNIIDIDDVVSILTCVMEDARLRRITINVANPVSLPVTDIVAMMEKVTGKPAQSILVDDGAAYEIDISQIAPIIKRLGLAFDREGVLRVIEKYYGGGQ